MKSLLTSLLVTVSMTLTTARGMEDPNKDNPLLSLPPEIHFNVIGHTLNLTEEKVNILSRLGQQDELKPLTDQQLDILKSLNPEGIKDINHLFQTCKGMDTLMGDIMKGLKNLFPAMINHLGSFGIELNDEYFDKFDEQFIPSQEHINFCSFLSQHWLTLFDLENKTGFITSLGKKNNNASKEFKRGMETFNWLKGKQEEADELYEKNPSVIDKDGWFELMHKNLYLIPTQVFQQLDLKKLNISYNEIFFVSKEIRALKNLEELAIGINKLTSLPPVIGKLKKLKELLLWNNHLTTLPQEIRKLTNFKVLDLGCNKLTSLLPEIGMLKNLEALYLHENNLTSLPPVIGKLENLERLALWNNKLTSLPPVIGKLKNIRELYLYQNKLTTIFDDQGTNVIAELIENNQELKEINLENNPFDNASKTALRELEDKYPNMTIKW